MPLDDNSTEDQALILRISQEPLGSQATASTEEISLFEEHFHSALAECDLGVLDGNEFNGSSWTLYLYGPNADALFEVARHNSRDCTASRGIAAGLSAMVGLVRSQ